MLIDLDAYQAAVAEFWEVMHPGETISDIGNSLAEECGEVNRAIIKRKRGSSRSDDWDRDLRYETIDALVNLLAVAWKEDYSLSELLMERWPHFVAKMHAKLSDASPTPASTDAPLQHRPQRPGEQYMSNACIHERHTLCDEECEFCRDGCACDCHPWNAPGADG